MSDSDSRPSKSLAGQSDAVSHCDPSAATDEPSKKKDAWGKAQIISGFLSSVVIAGIGILINISIQRTQITASEANTRAQIEVAERNNKAQLALTDTGSGRWTRIEDSWVVEQRVGWCAMRRGGEPWRGLLII